jgi:crotonobetainyl-CoA:carnitine CoA-transferase CaiB-like acyl-CoA transferase
MMRASTPSAPLADLRILAVEQFGAGPWGSAQLADLGATVIKIEDPGSRGDVGRYVPPYSKGEDSLFFETFNGGKCSLSLDLRAPAGQRVFHHLVERVDAVLSNLRGDQPARLGLTYDALCEHNERIVCASLSGFGMTGPRQAEPAYDYVLQAMAGWMSLTGEPHGPPAKSGLSLVDFAAGYAVALTLLGAVWRARRDGVGGDCDVSLFDVALSLLTYVGTWSATNGHVVPRLQESSHPSIVPFQAFRCSDGWITVAAAKQKFWERLCEAMGLEELQADERFGDFAGRERHRDELLPVLRGHFAERSCDHWVAALEEAGVPVGRVNDVKQALEDKQAQARGAVVEYEHERLGTVRRIASPLRISGHSTEPRPAPARGANTEELLRALCGYGDEDIREARRGGAFG